ncbi:hypothetical protein GOP47_0023922 [Adiantum capillus-veneris]|uniref:Uncharacterized protein n=1 Tax=Adiantum capillus-veneris TaxID=13818 RepID=A0A9D4Z5L9_ADICA|nr:hypothetical protein GOP47_0023922 [Adiantum capillus-veneris]
MQEIVELKDQDTVQLPVQEVLQESVQEAGLAAISVPDKQVDDTEDQENFEELLPKSAEAMSKEPGIDVTLLEAA